MGFEQEKGISQLSVKRVTNREIIMLLAKVTDDLLLADNVDTMKYFVKPYNRQVKGKKNYNLL